MEQTSNLLVDTFLEGIGATVRTCIDCEALVVGGPTRCVRCAVEGPPRARRNQNIDQRVVDEMFSRCPFCDEKPNVFAVPQDGYEDYGWVVECKDMGCIFGRSKPHQSFKMLWADWNRREGRAR